MSDRDRRISDHYTQRNLGESILAALRRMGKDVNALVPEDLAAVDEFHDRGREGTAELAKQVSPREEWSVLDVGCGLGGSARFLAHAYGCRVTGLDLTEEYCRVATLLSKHTGLEDKVGFQQGSALEMPFDSESFQLAWTEHAQMNIEDKETLYGEIRRVLKPGGKFAFHDIFAGEGGDPYFPAPWADDPAISSLITPGRLRPLLQSIGFDIHYWENRTVAGRNWFVNKLETLRKTGPPPLGFHLLMGGNAREKMENNLRNLQENRIVLIQAVLEKI